MAPSYNYYTFEQLPLQEYCIWLHLTKHQTLQPQCVERSCGPSMCAPRWKTDSGPPFSCPTTVYGVRVLRVRDKEAESIRATQSTRHHYHHPQHRTHLQAPPLLHQRRVDTSKITLRASRNTQHHSPSTREGATVQPATSAVWEAVNNLTTVISWISWRCEAARFGAISASAGVTAGLREVRNNEGFPLGILLHLIGHCSVDAQLQRLLLTLPLLSALPCE